MNKRVAHVASITALVLALVLTPAALAGKGGKPSGGGATGSSVSLKVLNSPDGLPHFGGQVTFNVSTSASLPQVNLLCYQGGVWVYEDWRGFSPDAWFGQVFNLGPNLYWTGGEADCTARLVTFTRRGTQNTLATTSFHVWA
jgi:hypothetical protein